jgi:Tfp pilus assembly protein FimT
MNFSKNGITLVELLIIIVLMFIAGVALIGLNFTKEEDLQKQGSKETLENIIRAAW